MVLAHSDDVIKICIFLLRNQVFALAFGIREVDGDDLVLRGILIGENI